MIIPLVMSGGAGTRLWPLSRADMPKQFHALIGAETMFARTLARLAPDHPSAASLGFGPPVVVFNERHLGLVRDELAAAGMPPRALVLEPMGRNTAPAVAAALIASATADTQDLMLMLPADHLIADTPAFHRAIADGAKAARAGSLVTFGIVPDRPETGFGYIRRGARDGASFVVEAFVEKPDRATAEQYLATGEYSWNAGIFLFRTDIMAGEFSRQRPDLWAGVESALIAPTAPGAPWRLDAEKFARLKGESLDYAVMEGAARVNVVPVDMGWDDIGSWSQLHSASAKDDHDNAVSGDVITHATTNSYVLADHGLVATVGVDNLIIVRTGDTTLVADKSASQDVKAIVDELKARGRFEADTTPAVGPPRAPAAARRDEVRRWLFDTALPFWATAAIDPVTGTITETLGLDANPPAASADLTLRLRVAARQLYTFAHARQLGFTGDADRVIEAAFTYLTRHGWHPEGGFIHLTDRTGRARDTRRDTYDHAFVLLAFAHMAKATGRSDALDWFEKTATFVEENLRDDTPGLYLEGLPATTPRRANPHMHLLEAWLAAYELTGDAPHLARSDAIVARFYDRFFDAETWTVTEFFDETWQPAPGEAGRICEPGHHYEWIWLLKRHAAISANPTVHDDVCRKLFAVAEAYGRNHATAMIYDAITKDGRPLQTTSRCWPQTEALKALLIMDQTGTPGLGPRIDETLTVLLDCTLSDCPSGCWMDRYEVTGKPIATDIPASTLYHLFVALTELLDPL